MHETNALLVFHSDGCRDNSEHSHELLISDLSPGYFYTLSTDGNSRQQKMNAVTIFRVHLYIDLINLHLKVCHVTNA